MINKGDKVDTLEHSTELLDTKVSALNDYLARFESEESEVLGSESRLYVAQVVFSTWLRVPLPTAGAVPANKALHRYLARSQGLVQLGVVPVAYAGHTRRQALLQALCGAFSE